MAPARDHGSQEFSFVLEEAQGFRVDTRAGTVTKDMIADPDTTIRLRFSRGDLRAIQRAFRAVHLLDVPEPSPLYPKSSNGLIEVVQPSTAWTLDLDMDGQHRHWTWDTSRRVLPATAQWDTLHAAVRTVRKMVEEYQDYRDLPSARGAYE